MRPFPQSGLKYILAQRLTLYSLVAGAVMCDGGTGLRVLYPNPSDTLRVVAIRGHILNADPLSLPASSPGVTGVFGSHVAVDAASGAVVGATVGGWSCSDPGPAQFDGSYASERVPTGRR